MNKVTKARAYCLTLNNYTQMDLIRFHSHIEECSYGIVGKEKGEKGTPHLQAYFHYKAPRSFDALKKRFPKAHIELARGDDIANKAYCSKDGDYVEHGEPTSQGQRSDIAEIRQIVESGGTMPDVLSVASSYQSARMGEMLIQYRKPSRRLPLRVVWIYGPSGTGKTHRAFEMAGGEDYWVSGRDLRWFQGYCGQKVAIIDDFRADYCKFHELLRYLDQYPVQVEYKGGSCWWVPELIIVTSCYSPSDVYKERTGEDMLQLTRRIHEIIKLDVRYVQN